MKHVMETGAFHYVRHPLYLSALLFYLGMSLLTMSLFALGVLLVMIFPFYQYISSYEEKIAEKLFGKKYREYKARTGKWFPRIMKIGKPRV